MADRTYREFHVEPIYAAPDTRMLAHGLIEGAQRTGDAIGNIFRGIAEQQRAQRAAADQYKFDLGEGKFENDDKIFYAYGLNSTEVSKNEIRANGRISPETQKSQQEMVLNKKSSDWQFKKFEQNEKDILAREKSDIYYDPSLDREANRLAAYGENNDVYYTTRGDRLEAFEKAKFKNPKSLKGKFYTFDYVGKFRAQEKEKKVGDPTAESTIYDKYTFVNEQGAPGVTVRHAKDYLNSRPDGDVARWIESLVDDDMDADVRYNKERTNKFEGMSDPEIKLYLKAHPEQNLYDTKDYASRVIERAQNELMESAGLSRKIDYQTKVDKNTTGGLYANDGIGHSYTTHQDAPTESKTGVGFQGEFGGTPVNPTGNNMPGGILRIGKGAKVGAAIPLDMNSQSSFNIRTGKNESTKGTTSYNLTGYQLGIYKNNGQMVPMDVNEINKIPLSQFKDLAPNLQVTLRGYAIDRGNTLGDIASRQSQLDDEMSAAIESGDVERQELVQNKITQLSNLKASMNLPQSEFSDDDLTSSLKRNGIATTNIRKDILLKASQSDIDLINRNITRGLNLADKSKWSDEMIAADEAYQTRYRQAQAAGFKDPESAAKKPAKSVPQGNVKVQSPDGKIGYIPASQLNDALTQGYKTVE